MGKTDMEKKRAAWILHPPEKDALDLFQDRDDRLEFMEDCQLARSAEEEYRRIGTEGSIAYEDYCRARFGHDGSDACARPE